MKIHSHFSVKCRGYFIHISVKPETAEQIILMTCCLHNKLRGAYLEKNGQPYYNLKQTEPRGFLNTDGFHVWDEYVKYFVNEGAIP